MPEDRTTPDLDRQLQAMAGWLDEQAAPVPSPADDLSAQGGGATDDGAAVIDLDAGEPARSPAAHPSRRPMILAAAAVVAVLALVAGALVLGGGEDDESAEVSTDVTAPPAGDLTSGWERIELAGTDRDWPSLAWSIESNGAQLLAISPGSCLDEEAADPAACVEGGGNLLLSDDDGASWTTVATAANARSGFTGMAWTGDRWIIAGMGDGRPTVWTLAAGELVQTGLLGDDGAISAVTTTDTGAVAVGFTGGSVLDDDGVPETPLTATAWRSDDPSGIRWDPRFVQETPLPGPGPAGHVGGVVTLDELVVAYGSTAEGAGDSEGTTASGEPAPDVGGSPTAWLSRDLGATWEIHSIGGSGHDGHVGDAVVAGDEVVLVGQMDGEATAWTITPRGTVSTRQPLGIDPLEQSGMGRIASGPHGLVATGGLVSESDDDAVLFVRGSTQDEWRVVDDPDLLPESTAFDAPVAHGDGFLIYGLVAGADGSSSVPTLWRWSPPAAGGTPSATASSTPATTEAPAPTTTNPPPTTTGFVPDIGDPSCFPSYQDDLDQRIADPDGEMAAEWPEALDALRTLDEAGIGARWDEAGVCVQGSGLSDSYSVDVVDHTLSAELEAETLALVPEGTVEINRIPWEPIPGDATWELAPDQEIRPFTTEFDVLVTEMGCASGASSEGRIAPPEVRFTDIEVTLTFTVYGSPGAHTCPSNPATTYHVVLDEPIGNRALAGMSSTP
jgi:hypothetical protein